MGTVVRPAQLAALNVGLDMSFMDAYKSDRPLVYPLVTTEITATKKSILFPIMDMLPQMREWVGDRVFNNPGVYTQTVDNKHYELSMELDADDVADDDISAAFVSAAALGDRATEHPDVLLAKALQAASGILGFDQQYFFDTDHPINARDQSGGSQANVYTGKPLNATNWEFAVTTMAGWKAGPGAGQLIGSVPNAVIVPRQLEVTARKIFEPETVPNTAGTAVEQNIFRGAAKVIVFDFLNNQPTTWYPVDLRSRLKPIIYVKREAAKFVQMNRPNDRMMFENNKIQFGVDGRWGVGLSAWFKAMKLSP